MSLTHFYKSQYYHLPFLLTTTTMCFNISTIIVLFTLLSLYQSVKLKDPEAYGSRTPSTQSSISPAPSLSSSSMPSISSLSSVLSRRSWLFIHYSSRALHSSDHNNRGPSTFSSSSNVSQLRLPMSFRRAGSTQSLLEYQHPTYRSMYIFMDPLHSSSH